VADLTIRARRDGPLAVLDLAGEARLERIASLRREAKSVRDAGAKDLLLGLGGVTFADSASVGVFLELKQACAASGGKFGLFGLPPRLARQMADMGLAETFPTFADEPAARRALA
jgi:anti-sigma B factor antagonist